MNYEIYQDAAGQWRWRLRARNGEIVASGEDYTRKADVMRAIATIRRGMRDARVVRIDPETDAETAEPDPPPRAGGYDFTQHDAESPVEARTPRKRR